MLAPFISNLTEKDSLKLFNDSIISYKNFSKVALSPEEDPDDNPDLSLERFRNYSLTGFPLSCNKS